MNLSEYLNHVGKKPTAFANEVPVAPSTIYRYLAGLTKMNFETAELVSSATGGKVTVATLCKKVNQHG